MKKKGVYFVFMILIAVSVVEGIAYLFWKLKYNWNVVEYYKAIIESTKNYAYNDELKLVMPVPGTTIVHATPEYIDRFKINEIKGFGVFDDGVDKGKELYALVLGDSFTRGTGSLDNLEYGWVEIVEKRIRKVDLLNLGNHGTGQVIQMKSYDKLKNFLEHQLVILNFFTGGDFYDNVAKYFELSDYVADLPKEVNKDRIIRNILYGSNYKISFHYMAYSPVKSYSIWFVLKVFEKFVSSYLPFNSFENDYYAYEESRRQKFNNIPDHVKDLIPERFIQESSPDNRFVFNYDERLYMKNAQNIADRIAKHSACIVNDFFNNVKKEFILIIHPSKEEIYLSGYKRLDSLYDFDYIRNKFKDYLSADIRVYDITYALRERAKKLKAPLYYKIDGHYTQAGYKEVADLIYEVLINDEAVKKIVNDKWEEYQDN